MTLERAYEIAGGRSRHSLAQYKGFRARRRVARKRVDALAGRGRLTRATENEMRAEWRVVKWVDREMERLFTDAKRARR